MRIQMLNCNKIGVAKFERNGRNMVFTEKLASNTVPLFFRDIKKVKKKHDQCF